MRASKRFITLTSAAVVAGISIAGAAQADGGGEYTYQNPHSTNYHADSYYDQRDTNAVFDQEQNRHRGSEPVMGLGSQHSERWRDDANRDDRWWRDNDGYK